MRVCLWLVLAGLTGLAFTARMWGIEFGLPLHLHPDEPAHVLEPLALARGIPDALSFANPPLFKELLLAVYAITGWLRGPTTADGDGVFVLARGTSACLGALTVSAAYGLGAVVRSPRAGLLSAVLTAACYLLVRESHFAVNDALVTLIVPVALTACVRVLQNGTRREYGLAGVALGAAFAAKYQAIAVALPLLVAHLARRRRYPRGVTDLLITAAGTIVTLVVLFPSLFIEPRRVLADFYVFDILPARLGYDGIDPGVGYSYYAWALGVGLGWPLFALAVLGILRPVLQRDVRVLVLASFPVALFVVMGASHMYFARFLLPATPVLIVLAAVVLDDVWRRARVVAGGLFAAAVVWMLVTTIRFDALIAQPDTRLEATAWVASHLATDARIAADAPPLGPPVARGVSGAATLYDATVEDYRHLGVEYIITSSFVAEAQPIDPERDRRRRAFYAVLRREADEIAIFSPYAGAEQPFVYDQIYAPFSALFETTRPGPAIRVFRLR
ncbi:MAG: hypothetical protein NVSMB2_20200 [Chloroflexota bacterium]